MPLFVGDPVRPHRRLQQIWRAALVTAGYALIAFHVWLFFAHVADGRVSDPLTAFRWGVGLVLAGLLAGLKRRGASLIRSRSAAACWVLVLFLHWSTLAPGGVPALQLPSPVVPGAVLVVLPAVGSMAAFATAVFLLLLARRSSIARLAPAGPVLEPAPSVCLSAGFLLSRFPRPPPAR